MKMAPKSDLPQGTHDLLILRIVAQGPIHGSLLRRRSSKFRVKRSTSSRGCCTPPCIDWNTP
jgi:hypothetical protein